MSLLNLHTSVSKKAAIKGSIILLHYVLVKISSLFIGSGLTESHAVATYSKDTSCWSGLQARIVAKFSLTVLVF